MASEDVIELGSSDDEAEPAPKKRKPALNAMVHFPNKFPDITVKSTKPALPPLQKVLAGGAITVTNIKTGRLPTPPVIKIKSNNRLVQKPPQKLAVIRPAAKTVHTQNNFSINPLSIIKSQQKIRVQPPKLNLPPGITVKRTAPGQAILGDIPVSRKKSNFKRKLPDQVMTTVELDDDVDTVTSGVSPQWYLRPEEQSEQPVKDEQEESKDKPNNVNETKSSIEEENNREPDTSKFIEITIEDSPVKPLLMKSTHEIGAQLAITIEDSPVKPGKEQPYVGESDGEEKSSTEPQSKKKLEYQKGEEVLTSTDTVENVIEIDLEKSAVVEVDENNAADKKSVVDIEPKEKIEVLQVNTSRKIKPIQISKEVTERENLVEHIHLKETSEFHPVYQRFIDLCFKLENSDDMTKIVEKKIKTYYRQCPKEYVESEEFIDMVSSKIFAMEAGPDKMYLYIKDIVDELNLQRKTAKAVEAVTNKENKHTESDKYFCDENTEYDSKRRRQIRKLEKTIKKLHRAIQKLEEQEVEFDDEEDSVYLLTERYKERLIRVHAKFCQLTQTKMPSEPRIQIEARPGRSLAPAKKLEKWVNRKVPIGAPLPFPDFHDVLRCVRDANDEDRLGWNEADIMEEARDLFTRCGKKLQRRRQENEWRIAASRIAQDVSTVDPAESSEVLKKKLDENKTVAAKKETELLNKYADKQNQLKLIPEEIGDKEAEESPVESEDEEINDGSNSLEDKEKRKDRLRRLLHEKTRKMSAEKESISTNEPKDNKEEMKAEKENEENDGGSSGILMENDNNKNEDIQEEIKESDYKVISIENVTENTPSNDQNLEKIDDCDSYSIDSDIDELHLLQKLYFEDEIHSSTQESDSDTPIAISDTLDSDSETDINKTQLNYDIISIENSSYSESEMNKDECLKEQQPECIKNKGIESKFLVNPDIELPFKPKSKVDEYDENILLASSDEEMDTDAHLHIDQIKDNTSMCETNISSNDVIIGNDDAVEIIPDKYEENSEENMIVEEVVPQNNEENYETIGSSEDVIMKNDDTDEVSLDKYEDTIEDNMTIEEVSPENYEENAMITNDDNAIENDVIDNRENLNDFEVNKSIIAADMTEEDKCNPHTIDITSNDVTVTNKESYTENNVITDTCENVNIYKENNTVNEEINFDNHDINNTLTNEFISKNDTDIIKANELLHDNDIHHKSEEMPPSSVKTISADKDVSELEGVDDNDTELPRHESSTNQIIERDDIDLSSVQKENSTYSESNINSDLTDSDVGAKAECSDQVT